jgi:hypothetical protein
MQESYKKRIEDEMQLRGLSPDTIECYTDCIKLFMNHFHRKRPSQINVQDVKNYHRKLRNRGQCIWRSKTESLKPIENNLPELFTRRWRNLVYPRENFLMIVNKLIETRLSSSLSLNFFLAECSNSLTNGGHSQRNSEFFFS